MGLELRTIRLRDANEFVGRLHRHHKPVVGHKFSLAVYDGEKLVGVAICGRPVARKSDDGRTLEVNRLCTDGTKNACSFLYGAARRAALALGYRRILTFILDSEPGTSLKASGWQMTGTTPGKSWSVPSRPREDHHPICTKQRWEATL